MLLVGRVRLGIGGAKVFKISETVEKVQVEKTKEKTWDPLDSLPPLYPPVPADPAAPVVPIPIASPASTTSPAPVTSTTSTASSIPATTHPHQTSQS